MDERTRWIAVTAALGLGWAVVVALLVVVFTDWSTDIQALVGGDIGMRRGGDPLAPDEAVASVAYALTHS